jgi:hypothetical protein
VCPVSREQKRLDGPPSGFYKFVGWLIGQAVPLLTAQAFSDAGIELIREEVRGSNFEQY